MHAEDGLIYLGVVVEMVEEPAECLIRFGDCTERWSSFNELQRLGEISDDKCSPPSTPAPSEFVGIEDEAQTRVEQSRSTLPKSQMRMHSPEQPADENNSFE